MASPATARTASDGFIVVAVLWILAALATLATVYAIYVANAAVAVAANDDAIEAEALVYASLELTAYRLLGVPKEKRPTSGEFDFRIGRANVSVDFRSETARVDLNQAPKELLAGLFEALGASPEEADQFADRVIGWRTPPAAGPQDKETSLYRAAGLNYGPRGGDFAHVDELWLLPGLPPALIERALPFITVFSGRAEVNVLDAAPEVLAALPGMTPERLNAVLGLQLEPSQSGRSASTVLGPTQTFTTTEGGKVVRVTARIAFDNGRHMASEAVILVDGRREPYRILSWQDDVNAPAVRPQLSAGALP